MGWVGRVVVTVSKMLILTTVLNDMENTTVIKYMAEFLQLQSIYCITSVNRFPVANDTIFIPNNSISCNNTL